MKKFYDYLSSQGLTPNGYYVLHATINGYYHDKYINIRTEQHRLAVTDFLIEDGDRYTLTSKATDIVKTAEKLLVEVTKKIKKVPYGAWETEITQFNNLFPKGKRDGSSIAYRTNPKELHERFMWFFETYPEYNWEMILDVTKKYVETTVENDVRYLQSSKYFIKKQDKNLEITSTLASLCWNLVEGNDEEVSAQGFHYFGP